MVARCKRNVVGIEDDRFDLLTHLDVDLHGALKADTLPARRDRELREVRDEFNFVGVGQNILRQFPRYFVEVEGGS